MPRSLLSFRLVPRGRFMSHRMGVIPGESAGAFRTRLMKLNMESR